MPTICQTSFQYVSSTLATSTQVCADPLNFAWLMLLGIGLFLGCVVFGFWVMYKR